MERKKEEYMDVHPQIRRTVGPTMSLYAADEDDEFSRE
jgi:hypothetical protein